MQNDFHDISRRVSPCDLIRRIDQQGNEYWSARDQVKSLTYEDDHNSLKVVARAKTACEKSENVAPDHFVEMVRSGSNARQEISEVYLSRYACSHIVRNSDPEKPVVAPGQTDFAVQTCRQGFAEQAANLPESQSWLILRAEMALDNQRLDETARTAEVFSPGDFAICPDHDYRGFSGALTEHALHAHKGLAPEEHILDDRGGEEPGANIFWGMRTEAKLKREQVKGRGALIKRIPRPGGRSRIGESMSGELSTPEKSIQLPATRAQTPGSASAFCRFVPGPVVQFS